MNFRLPYSNPEIAVVMIFPIKKNYFLSLTKSLLPVTS